MSVSAKSKNKVDYIVTQEVGNFSASLRAGCYLAFRRLQVVPESMVAINRNNAHATVWDVVAGKKVKRGLYVRVEFGSVGIEDRTTYTYAPQIFEKGWAQKARRIVRSLLLDPGTKVRRYGRKKPAWM